MEDHTVIGGDIRVLWIHGKIGAHFIDQSKVICIPYVWHKALSWCRFINLPKN
jgi:hypothetical protein